MLGLVMDKRGQGLSTTAIVLIILGVIVLVVLVIGFTIGWNQFSPYLASNNVNTVVNSCSAACSSGNIYDYCSLNRTLKANDLPSGKKQAFGNCSYFSTAQGFQKYAIETCTSISCPKS